MTNHGNTLGRKIIFPGVVVLLLLGPVCFIRAQLVTNLQQLTQSLSFQEQVHRDVRLQVTVCAASRPAIGVLIVQDDSGVELLEVGDFGPEIHPGEKVRIQGDDCLLRKRETGIELSAVPVVNNDGTHPPRTSAGNLVLQAGPTPLRLDWFNCLSFFGLQASYSISNGPAQSIESSNLCHAVVDAAGRTNFLPGLHAECYEGYWEMIPDFDLVQPVRSGMVTNFDLGFRTRDERVGLRFTGYFNAPRAGQYKFSVNSDDGSLLFLVKSELPVERIGAGQIPATTRGFSGQSMTSLTERRWVTVRGRASFVSKKGAGLEFELHSDRDVISVWLADAAGLDPSRLLNAQITVTGAARGVARADERIVLGRLFAASPQEIVFDQIIEGKSSEPITSVVQVQSLLIEAARRELPVRIRGVVTDVKNPSSERWMSIQDETRGIFVNLKSITNARPAFREFWQVEGHSGAGDFAPVIIADKISFLGEGRLPEPLRPTWTELLDGSMDVQWAELHGVVTTVQSNNLSLLLPEGQVKIRMDGYYESQLKSFEKCIINIRGVLYAMWNADTRAVRVGMVMMRNALISVDSMAPSDPFDAVVKTPRELLLFDPQATAFRRVKVRGQIVYADATQLFLEAGATGLQLLPSEPTDLRAGDLVEAVGYPDLSRTTLALRDAVLRKTGEAPLPDSKNLSEFELPQDDLNSTRVRIQGQLLGWHFEQGAPVLEMQSGTHLYLARLAQAGPFSLRVGSELALDGVYVGRAVSQPPNVGTDSFELRMNSATDIKILSEPSLWTLQRLLVLVGILLAILTFTAIWITQLRRLVGRRTAQLQRETRERERVEHQHALEAERSRIARDLHDELGTGLTEVSLLSSAGLGEFGGEEKKLDRFRVIAEKARALVAGLDVIVWAVDPKRNSLESFADYTGSYAKELFSNSHIVCRLQIPIECEAITLPGHVRHNLFLAVKEALNNVIRHASATEVALAMTYVKNQLEIIIADNGRGFDENSVRRGRGLTNLYDRLTALHGNCEIKSQSSQGTVVKFSVLLSRTSEEPKIVPQKP